MSTLHFFCSSQQRDIDSGIDVDPKTYRQTRLNIVHVDCPWCAKTHRFLVADGRRRALYVRRRNPTRRAA